MIGTFGNTSAQDVIYKTNGEVILVGNLTLKGKIRKYNLPADKEGTVWFISTDAIDSIIYANGTKDVFQSPLPKPLFRENEKLQFKRNSIGFNAAALAFYSNIKLSYRYMVGNGTIGISAAFLKNLNPSYITVYDDYTTDLFYTSLIKNMRWSAKTGIDIYSFDPGSFRIFGGFHWITGKYTTEEFQNLNQESWFISKVNTNNSINGILFSPMFIWQPANFWQLGIGMDIPLYTNRRFSGSFLGTEASLIF
ncbi:MAG: hypothetical protein ACP5D9_18285 [Mariniphaga sp.]